MSLPALGGSVSVESVEDEVNGDVLGVDFVTPADRFARADDAGTRQSAIGGPGAEWVPTGDTPRAQRLTELWRSFLGRGAMTIRPAGTQDGDRVPAETALQLDGDLVVYLDPAAEDAAAAWARHVADVRAHLEGVRLTLEAAAVRVVTVRMGVFGLLPTLSAGYAAGTADGGGAASLALGAAVAGGLNLGESWNTRRALKADVGRSAPGAGTGTDAPAGGPRDAGQPEATADASGEDQSEDTLRARVVDGLRDPLTRIRASRWYNYLLMGLAPLLTAASALRQGATWPWVVLALVPVILGLLGYVLFRVGRGVFLGERGKKLRRSAVRAWKWIRSKTRRAPAPAVH